MAWGRDALVALRRNHVLVRNLKEALHLALDECDVDFLVLYGREEILEQFLGFLDTDAVLLQQSHVAHETRDGAFHLSDV